MDIRRGARDTKYLPELEFAFGNGRYEAILLGSAGELDFYRFSIRRE